MVGNAAIRSSTSGAGKVNAVSRFLRMAQGLDIKPKPLAELNAVAEGRMPKDPNTLIDEGLAVMSGGKLVLTTVGERARRYLRAS
jgi:hypothetical protein